MARYPAFMTWKDILLSKVEYDPFGGCWLWAGSLKDNGYGILKYKGFHTRAHRASYEEFKNPIQPLELVLHKCDIRCCINPDHLYIGDHFINMQDMIAKGRDNPGGRYHFDSFGY